MPENGAADRGSSGPLVTAVVPVHNGERFLRESLESILGQTYRSVEVIVVDDASTDNSADVAASYGEQVTVVRQPTQRGIYGNANDGIARAGGELIGVFHADDVYLPEMVEREVEWLGAHADAGAVFCSDIFVDGDGRELGRLVLPPELRGSRPLAYPEVLNGLLRHMNVFLRCPTALVRASVYQELGGYRDAEFKNNSDVEMWLRIGRAYPLGVLEEHLLHYRRGHGSSSERYQRVRTDPNRFFVILDRELEQEGRAHARPDALRAYEAHRAEDILMRAVSSYVLDERRGARALLADLRLRRLAGSPAVERGRLTALALAMRLLVRVPHSDLLARLFARRWHGGLRSPTPVGPS